jgi:hypothetical protein
MAKKRSDFGVTGPEAHTGPTIDSTALKLAGASNTKRKASFGVQCGPNGDTFTVDRSHISMPNADKAPKESKTVSSSTGRYSPQGRGPQNFGGSVGVGKSSPK